MESRLVSPVLMWAVVIAGGLALYLLAPDYLLLWHSPVTLAVLAFALLNWIYFFLGALWVNRSAASSADNVGKLVTAGVYSKVRHPIYSADIVLAWAGALFLGSAKFLLAALWLTVVLYVWMGLEEKALLEKFGKEYEDYRRKVPKLMPRIKFR